MSKRVIILIDGQNLYYGLKDLKINERNVVWDKFFKSLLIDGDELVRTYWFRPQRILDTNHSGHQIRNTICYKRYSSHSHNYNSDPKSIPPTIFDQIEKEALEIEEWLTNFKEKFSQAEYKYDQISLEFGDIEVVKTGIVKVDPIKKLILGEKGVDISLAVKMMSLSVNASCDKIILVSGDYDYAEAIKFVKDKMTKIHLVKFHKGRPPQNRSVSRDLAILADKVIDVYEVDLLRDFIKKP